jgi:hypothetical protein
LLKLWMLALSWIVLCSKAEAFPELTRYGYANCRSCHVSPSGGGLTTNYGSAIAAEVLTSFDEPEKKPLLPSWINLGGDVRSIQTYINTAQYREAKYFVMQADLELALGDPKSWQLVGTGGLIQESPVKTFPSKLDSRRYYLLLKPLDNVSLRAGKFQRIYGLNTAEHAISTRRGLGFDEGKETKNLELGYSGNLLEGFLSSFADGFSATSSLFLFNRHKVGASYDQDSQRRLMGAWMINGWSEALFDHVEFDRSSDGAEFWYCKEGWNFRKGLVVYLSQDVTKKDSQWSYQAYGLGLQIFPYSHYEINLQWQKQAREAGFYDYALAMLHMYL